ncbi:MAG: glycosyltransferase family 2 protein [Candidatus Cloacimonetes bacterium]|nr:glycosyltransferase family 2 protein [Candidatus Cloacimonadota bacterium]
MGISVIIPTYNERANIEECIAKVRTFATSHQVDCQIIVVDSGSKDGTKEYLIENEQNSEDVCLVLQDQRLGMGVALREAYTHVNQEYVCHYECDCPFDLDQVIDACHLLKNECDFVLGHRVGERDSLTRILYTAGYRLFTFVMFGAYFKSINFSFKVFKSSVLQKIQLQSKAWFIDAELVIEVNKQFKVQEVDVVYTKRQHDQSTVVLMDVFHIMKEAFDYKFKG